MLAVDSEEVVAFALSYLNQGAPRVGFVAGSPRRWGEGLAAAVLQALTDKLAAQGHERATLFVYADNSAAVGLYERLGWTRAGSEPTPHSKTGRPELRYSITLGA